MNQGKLPVIKQEMARVNVDILGLNKLKWTGMSEFNSDDLYIYYCGQESLRRNGVAIIVNKRVRNTVHGCNLKNNRMIYVSFQGKTFSITVIQVYVPTSNEEVWSWMILRRPTRPSRTNTKKRCPFHHRGWECKRKKSKDAQNNTQVWPWSTKWSRANAKIVLWREHSGIANTLFQQPKRRLYTWTSPDGQYQN